MRFKQFFLWVNIFHKRFLLKKGFIALLALIPLAGLALGLAAGMDGGALTVYLATRDDDPISEEIIESLANENGIIRFVVSDEKDAKDAVRYGKADAAWVFEDDLGEKIKVFAEKPTSKNHLVDIYGREEDISAMLMREKLSGVLFPYIGYELYIDFVREELSENIDGNTIDEYYAAVMPEGSELFDLSENREMEGSSEFLSAPLRGLLSVLCVLGGMTVTMFWISDREKGLFFNIQGAKSILFCFAYHFVAVFDLCIVMVASLYASGRGEKLINELVMAVLYALSVSLFCMIFLFVCRRMSVIATIAPILSLLMLIICPVFLRIAPLEPISKIFPPYYYLTGVGFGEMFLYILCEVAVLLTTTGIFCTLEKRS